LSQRLRKQSPFCELCGATADLTLGHIIPVSEAPELAYEICNLRVECRPCGSRRGTNCTEAERHAVSLAIEQRKQRAGAFYRGQAKSG
jgi:5-methylcytosine-specific restriction endonuclease McrA